jgi:biopolymer transport protein ExbD
MHKPNTPYQKISFSWFCVLLALSILSCSVRSQAQKDIRQPLVVSVEIVKGSRVYRVNRKVVEDTRDNSLLTSLETAASERGLDYPVIVLVDVKAPFTEVDKLETALVKIGFTHHRLFVGDFQSGLMDEFHWDQNGIPIPPNARPK